jgi:hypothetical protein
MAIDRHLAREAMSEICRAWPCASPLSFFNLHPLLAAAIYARPSALSMWRVNTKRSLRDEMFPDRHVPLLARLYRYD